MTYNIWDVAKDFIKGDLEIADAEIVKQRQSICEPCEARKLNICTACGCVLPAKVRLKDASCPMELW